MCTVPCHTWLPIETKTMAELSGFCYIFRQEKKHRNQHSQNFWLNTHVVIGIANDEGWIRNGQKDLNGQNQSDMSTSRFNCSHWIFRQMSWNEFLSFLLDSTLRGRNSVMSRLHRGNFFYKWLIYRKINSKNILDIIPLHGFYEEKDSKTQSKTTFEIWYVKKWVKTQIQRCAIFLLSCHFYLTWTFPFSANIKISLLTTGISDPGCSISSLAIPSSMSWVCRFEQLLFYAMH